MKRLDVALAAVLTVWMLGEVWAEHLHPAWVVVPTSLAAGASLAWRRRSPLAVLVVLLSAMTVQASSGTTLHSAVSPVVALLVGSWTVGAYERRDRAIFGLALLVAGIWLAMGIDVARGTDQYQGTDFPWIAGLLAAPGILGIVFGARTRMLHAAEARARGLEVERREAVAAERSRIARELHDVIAHSVAVMTVQAGAAEEMLKVDPSRAAEPVRAVQETGRQALVEMKRLVAMLREHDDELGLEPQPGVADVERLVAQVREAGLAVELRVEGEPRALPIGVELSAYRVVQEALTNALKHAGAASAVVTLRYGTDDLEVEVADDGRGGVGGEADAGHGLVGMRERVGVFGGTFAAGPRASGGFAVQARLPVEAPA